ncbi:MAG: hypothetical protein VB100_10755 [Angelakisella sp.]|nr:hypothetical protein [Angelakisella sp.]
MTKTIVTILLSLYSFVRLILVGYYYYHQELSLPSAVYFITAICASICLIGSMVVYFRHISGKKLRLLLFFNAVCTSINLFTVYSDTSTAATMWDLLIIGTFFDILFFMACCTFKLRDTMYVPARTPFVRLGAKNNNKRIQKKTKKTKRKTVHSANPDNWGTVPEAQSDPTGDDGEGFVYTEEQPEKEEITL